MYVQGLGEGPAYFQMVGLSLLLEESSHNLSDLSAWIQGKFPWKTKPNFKLENWFFLMLAIMHWELKIRFLPSSCQFEVKSVFFIA